MKAKRQRHQAAFKAKVGLEVLSRVKPAAEIAQEYQLHPAQVSQWKLAILDWLPDVVEHGATAQGEQFKDVALTVPNMHTVGSMAGKSGGLAHVFQSAEAFLLLDWHPGWIDLSFQGIAVLELLAGPKLDRRHTEGRPIQSDCQTAVGQDTAHCAEFDAPIVVAALAP